MNEDYGNEKFSKIVIKQNLNGKTEYKHNTKIRGRDIVRIIAQFYRIIQIRIQLYKKNKQYKVKDRIQ